MAEFHMLPSLKKESEYYLEQQQQQDIVTNSDETQHNGSTTTTTNNNNNNTIKPNEIYNEYETYIIQNWDQWNDEAIQRRHTSHYTATKTTSTSTSAKVPNLDHCSYIDYQSVYEPSDDTYLLLDAIQYDILQQISEAEEQQQLDEHEQATTIDEIRNNTPPPICLEIGCGTGVASVFFRTFWLEQQQQKYRQQQQQPQPFLLSYVTDINPKALQITKRTFQENQCKQQDQTNNKSSSTTPTTTSSSMVEYILCDLATPLVQQLYHKVSYIICNPPYVPTLDDEVIGCRTGYCCDSTNDTTNLITAAYAGGINGCTVIDRIIVQIIQLLQPINGIAYLVTIDENLPIQLALYIYRLSQYRLCMKPLLRKKCQNEFLTIQKITYL